MKEYMLLISEHIGYYVNIEADSEDEAIKKYYEEGGEGYGESTIETYVVEAKELK